MEIRNQVGVIRKARGIAASELARRVGVSRQTVYAIEAGTYVPNTEVALRLAHELEVSVEELFSLAAEREPAAEKVKAEMLSAAPPRKGQPVRLCRVGERTVGVPVSATPYHLPDADGTVAGAASVVRTGSEEFDKRLVLAGCDPAIGLLGRMVEHDGGCEIVAAPASSKLALQWLREGKVHIAGSHLEDAATGEFNLPYLQREFAGQDLAVITFARWEEGLVVAPGNPKSVRAVADLARRGVTFVNREPGAGARGLLDKLLAEAGVACDRVRGHDRIAYGHLAAAYAVASGDADCCLATGSAARAFGLDFVPLRSERYDLILRRETLSLPAAKAFFDVLQRAALRRKLEALAGYDTARTGAVLR